MKNLFELCQPRDSVFDETIRDDVLNLSNLIEGNINPEVFFAENYLTNGMKALFDAAFKRFIKAGATAAL